MSDKQAEIRKALAHIEANIKRTEMRKAWRNIDENTIEESYEFWVEIDRHKEGEQSSDS